MIRRGPHSRPGHHQGAASVCRGGCRVESRLVAERRGRAGTGHGYRHTGSHPFTPAVHHHRHHQHQHHQQSSAYILSSSILAQYYWAMGHGYPCIYLPKPQLRHQHQHPTWFASFKLVCFFPPAKCLFPVAGLIFGWQLDVAACCSRVCLRSHPHLTPVNWCGTGYHGRVLQYQYILIKPMWYQ